MPEARSPCTAFAATTAFLCLCAGQAARADLQTKVEEALAEEGLTGIAWALIEESGEAILGAAGLKDYRSEAPFTTSTRFHVGSLAKSLLATGVLALASEGRIDLDAPAVRYLPRLAFDNSWAGSSQVTVRHLLDHTSGLNDAHLWHLFSKRAHPDLPLISAFPEPAIQLHVRSEPGTRFSYSNMGYTLVGMVVEAVVGQRYEAYLDEQVLEPLGMHNSTFAFTTQEGERADPMLAWGHVDDGTRYAASPVFLRPAGQFTTTAADLARYAEFLLGEGGVDGRALVDGALMLSRGKAFGTDAAKAGLIAGYALGMGRRDRHGVVGVCHGGNTVGFVAMLCVFPDENKAFAYGVNTDSETADYGRLDRLFIEALDISRAQAPPTADPASDMSSWQGQYVPSPNRFQTFEYIDTIFNAIAISASGASLTLTPWLADARSLRPVSDRLFSASDRTTTSHVFTRGNEGEYLLSDGFQTFEKVPAAYLLAHRASLLLGLAGLAWILVAGTASLLRWRPGTIRRPLVPAFVASVLLFVPIPFFLTQSFMSLGDFTLASALLAVGTLFLPVGMFLTVLLTGKWRRKSPVNVLHGLAAAFVLQWCMVLMAANLLPLTLWR